MSDAMERLLAGHMDQDRKDFDHLQAQLVALDVKIDGLREEIARYKGFTGGIVFVITALMGFLSIFGHDILARLKGG